MAQYHFNNTPHRGDTDPSGKKSLLVPLIFLIVSLIFAGLSGGIVARDLSSHSDARREYAALSSAYTSPVASARPESGAQDPASWPETANSYPEREIDWDGLLAINPDCIGWLYFDFQGKTEDDSFTLDYPVVYETYKNQYLRTTFEGEKNNAGCIFLDMDSNPTFYGYSDIIYGHHMRDDSMFGTLEKIHEMDDLEWLKGHTQYLYIYTKTACHKYVLAAYEQVENSNGIAYGVAYDDRAYDQLKDNVRSLPAYMPSDAFNWRGRPEMLNLSTCDGPSGTSRRFLLHFVKVAAYAYE